MEDNGCGGDMPSSGNISKDASPYVCLSAHCDLLHFVGPVPHPYGGPTPQTVTERAARYTRFACESCETAPTVTVQCEHSLFLPVPTARTADGVPSFPLNGIELARWAYRENFESTAAQPHLDPHEKKLGVRRPISHGDSISTLHEPMLPQQASATPPVETASATVSGNSSYTVNFHALRRTILQALFILSLPKRSPAASFTLSVHDPSPSGVTRFFVLPRCAENVAMLAHPAMVSLSIARTTDGDRLHCCCQCRTEKDVEENRDFFLPLLWELNEWDEGEQYSSESVELNHFLNETMIPALFALPESLSRPTESEAVQVSQAVGWSQRRSFHFLALIAHCVWCEKVALYIIGRNTESMASYGRWKARLKLRDSASLESTGKWESTLLFYPMAFHDGCSHPQGTRGRLEVVDITATSCAALLQVTLRGCDEKMNLDWGGEAPHASTGSLSDLVELHERKR
ncbi:hypothetical protein TraAM80_04947 [Trypanosoma rangeli]|uniref:Uncharacterized protein n=1 Tax=Trypanosoma rangeli TaxID=5698 RepID=A0A422NGR6_TRYRA|nr:uncharacterized protein TraAM80_04947 [Trypanosoma rangeli]RNF04652.1 hypothetical protein TraAM80_04947 [Trypanosoma rangeli]|eukprot:RNF04652.1 hypothetical protein TraAM80_04947 [Trypanosoma rangeli]